MRLLSTLFLICASATASAKCPPQIEIDFRAALAARDEARIYAATAAAHACLGDPRPETPEQFEEPSPYPDAVPLVSFVRPYWDRVRPLMWWIGQTPPPSQAPAPLRQPAAAIRGAVLAAQLDPDRAADYLTKYAAPAAQYLLGAQAQGGADVFPVPAREGPSKERVFQVTDKFLKTARSQGHYDKVVRQGWIVDDFGSGDLQFDNGLAGEALLVLHAAQPDPKLLAAAIRAGHWAMRQPLSTNFNYNGFSAALLARLYSATGEDIYRREAIDRIRLGVLPGMITQGPFAGHWIDPHNERLVYRMIMVRQMHAVVAALPEGAPHRTYILERSLLAQRAIEAPFKTGVGIAHPATMSVMYCEWPDLKRPPVAPIWIAMVEHIAASLKAGKTAYDPHASMCALGEPHPPAQMPTRNPRP